MTKQQAMAVCSTIIDANYIPIITQLAGNYQVRVTNADLPITIAGIQFITNQNPGVVSVINEVVFQ